jgi:hypothetical protein
MKVLTPICTCKANREKGVITHIWGWWRYVPPEYGDRPERGFVLATGGCPSDEVIMHCPWINESDGAKRQTIYPGGTRWILKNVQWSPAEDVGYYAYGELTERLASNISMDDDDPSKVAFSGIVSDYLVHVSNTLVMLTASPQGCERLCATDSSFCPEVSPDTYALVSQGVSQLYNLFRDASVSAIGYPRLTNMFQISASDNRCERGDITISDGRFKNSGQLCNIKTKVPSLDESVVATIVMPEQLEGALTKHPTQIEMTFNEALNAPSLMFDKEGPQNTWGGQIQKVLANPSRLIVSTSRACIKFALGEN